MVSRALPYGVCMSRKVTNKNESNDHSRQSKENENR